MNIDDAIYGRRSIRKFSDTSVPHEHIEAILDAGVQAPSAKNRQPWRYVVLEGGAGNRLAHIMREGAAYCKTMGIDVGSCEWSAACVEAAPVTVLILNAESTAAQPWLPEADHTMMDLVSVGACIQNMLLKAHALGLGTLWIGDILYAYQPIRDWLNIDKEIVSAVSIGYPAENPGPRPRNPREEITQWVD